MLHATCHCGAVRLSIPRPPEAVTNCNCSVCRRYGTLWAYFHPAEVVVDAVPQALQTYQAQAQTLWFVRCATCGCVTHWRPVPGRRKAGRMGVNIRMFDPAEVGPFTIRFLDGAVTEEVVGTWSPAAGTL